MVEGICSDILGKVCSPSDNFEEFVGIEYHIEKMRSLLCLDSEEVRMVGIWGASGIGKTIIARALFSNLSGQFQRSIFLDRAFISECKEGYGRPNFNDYNMKKRLQGKFLSEIMNQKSMRIGPMEERLKHEKVLIFIDDLDDPHVLNALAGQTRWFGSGSRIIVVTTDRSLLKAHGIRFTYEVDLPSRKTALEIFCGAAFKQNYPPDGLMKFASEVVERAGRLPLGLNVLGLSLRGLNKEKCLKMLPRLRGSLDGSIEETLRVSYDVLRNENDKKLFRYIACLFPENKYVPSDFERLESFIAYSGLDDGIGLDNLVDKALIHDDRAWNNSSSLKIHRLLKDMGKTIVRNQSKNPGEREYIMDSKDICDVLKDATGTSKVLGISLDTTEIDEFHVHENAFKSMPDLSFLRIDGDWFKNLDMSTESKLQLPESFDHLPPKLKCLYWSKYPMKRLPSTFHPHNLVKLNLENSKLEKLWEGVKSLTCLKKMDLRDSKYLKEIPDLSMATNLEELILNSCTSLVELPSSIRNLNKLKELSMRYCTKLETLPSGIHLESLERLDLAFCSRLKSFPDISTNISSLNLIETAIEEVPWWIGKFYLLKALHMKKCSQLKYVHPNLYKLKHLREDKFDNCEALIRDDSRGYSSGKDAEAYSSKEDMIMDTLSVSGYSSGKKMEEDTIDTDNIESDNVPEVNPDFFVCYKFKQYPLFAKRPPSKQVPSDFTHQTTGTSMTNIPLLHTSLSQASFRFRVGLCVLFTHPIPVETDIHVKCWFNGTIRNVFDSFGRRHIFIIHRDPRLHVFDCCIPLNEDNAHQAQQNYDHVEMQIQIHVPADSGLSLTGWGVRLLDEKCDYCDADLVKKHSDSLDNFNFNIREAGNELSSFTG